jgi:hypothetical protein
MPVAEAEALHLRSGCLYLKQLIITLTARSIDFKDLSTGPKATR